METVSLKPKLTADQYIAPVAAAICLGFLLFELIGTPITNTMVAKDALFLAIFLLSINSINYKEISFTRDFILVQRYLFKPIIVEYSTYRYQIGSTYKFENYSLNLAHFANKAELASVIQNVQSLGLIALVEKTQSKKERRREIIVITLCLILIVFCVSMGFVILHDLMYPALLGLAISYGVLFIARTILKPR